MPKATWKDVLLAQSEHCEVVDGRIYFPPESLDRQYFQDSSYASTCGWKGLASYLHVVVGDQMNKNAAWYYDLPKPLVQKIAGYVTFGKDVIVEDD